MKVLHQAGSETNSPCGLKQVSLLYPLDAALSWQRLKRNCPEHDDR